MSWLTIASAKESADPAVTIWALIIILIIVAVCWAVKSIQETETAEETAARNEARKNEIYKKYGHTEMAERIINMQIWTGETAEQLVDSLGRPAALDDHVLKAKRKETWKYHQTGQNRFALRITVENGIVVGWDKK